MLRIIGAFGSRSNRAGLITDGAYMFASIVLTLSLIASPARAHWGNESDSNGRDSREAYTLDERFAVLRALVLGARHAPAGLLKTRSEGDDGVYVSSRAPGIAWSERGDRVTGHPTDAVLALFKSIMLGETRDGFAWNDANAGRLLRDWTSLREQAPENLLTSLRVAALPLLAVTYYVRSKAPSALAWFAHDRRAAIASTENLPYGRASELFGPGDDFLRERWPATVWTAKSKRPVMNLLMTMVVIALEDGLRVDLGRSDLPPIMKEAAIDTRLEHLTPVLRQIRDTLDFARAPYQSGPLRDTAIALTPLLDEYMILAARREAERMERGAPVETLDRLDDVARKIWSTLRYGAYLTELDRACEGRLLR